MPQIVALDSEVDRLTASHSTAGFQSLAHFCRAAGAIQMLRASKRNPFTDSMHSLTTDQSLMRSWVSAQVKFRNWEIGQAGPRTSLTRAVASPDGMSENSEPGGGALIPPGFVKQVFDKARQRPSMTPFGLCRVLPVTSNAGTFPGVAETSLADGSRWGGIDRAVPG